MKKIVVNQEACIGCGACVAIDSNHFAFNDEGLSHSINNENLDSEELKNAINTCPTCAISISDGSDEDASSQVDSDECCGCCEHCSHEEV